MGTDKALLFSEAQIEFICKEAPFLLLSSARLIASNSKRTAVKIAHKDLNKNYLIKVYRKFELSKNEVSANDALSDFPDDQSRSYCAVCVCKSEALGLLIFEDVGSDADWLSEILLGNSLVKSRLALISLAQTMGEFHACGLQITRSRHEHQQNPYGSATLKSFKNSLAKILPAGEVAVLTDILSPLFLDTTKECLVHRDICPDNVAVHKNGSAKLIDFEHASWGNPMIDLVTVVAGFPQCWCFGFVPQIIRDDFLETYWRTIETKTGLVIADFDDDYVLAGLFWLLKSIIWAEEFEDDWGTVPRTQRVLVQAGQLLGARSNVAYLNSANGILNKLITERFRSKHISRQDCFFPSLQ